MKKIPVQTFLRVAFGFGVGYTVLAGLSAAPLSAAVGAIFTGVIGGLYLVDQDLR